MVKPLDPSAFIGKFVEEARDRLRSLSEELLELEKNPRNGEKLQEVLRQAHTLKGSAKMLGLNDISQVAHRMEDMFVFVKEGRVSLSSEAYDILFGSIDLLSARVEELANGIKEPMNVAAFVRKLEALSLSRQAAQVEPRAEESALPRYSAVPPEAAPQSESPSAVPDVKRSLRVSAEKIDELANLAAEMVIQNLQMSERHAELRRIESLLRQFKDRVRETQQGLTGGGNGLGVQLGEQLDSLEGIGRRVGQFAAEFNGDQVRMNLITEELRQNVISLTMLPMSTVFDAFPRAARDLAREFDKEVDLTVQGSETELDKKIIEQIGDSLVHLVRNAIDHGIESPEERERLGKPRRGEILLSAQQQGNRILIGIQDDGRGINPAELRYVAARKGLVAETDLDRWKEKDLLNLIFYPGFSTSQSVTDVSGRGVGMDVVKITVERLQGAVNVDSRLGKGTSIVLDLPVSLALLRALLVEVRGELFAVPTGALDRILYVRPDQIRVLQDGQVLDVGGESIPLVSMGALLQLPPPVNPSPLQAVVVGRAFTRRFGMMVDAIHEEQEFVFKELRGRLRNQRLFSGVSILGSGQLVLIVEVNEVFQMATRAPAVSAPVAAEVKREVVPASILVVEDSYITGELERGILHAAGYGAEIAQDGIAALEALQKKKYDLVVADVDMPRMDGFELTSRIRGDERLRDIPVIIVTARESHADRRRGIEVGADAYIMKREFDQSHLLETVQRLIGR